MTIKRKLLTGLVFVMALSLASINVSTVANAFTAGPLTMQALSAPSFANVTLDGKVQIVTAAINTMTLVDATGDSAGWSVQMKATQFTHSTGGETPVVNTLRLNSLVLGEVSIASTANGSSPASDIVVVIGSLDNVANASGSTAGVRILTAGVDKGMGNYLVTLTPLRLTLIPSEVKALAYTSTITVALTTGPNGDGKTS